MHLFTKKELEKIKENLEEQRDWLEYQGIPYIIVIAPDKNSIYPEFLPDNIKKIQEKTRLDQLIEYLSKNSDLNIIDLREPLISKKGKLLLYSKTDTHWNQYGAFIGYKEIMKVVDKYFLQLQYRKIKDYNLVVKNGSGGDLANMLSMKDIIKEDRIYLQPKFAIKAHSITSDLKLTKGQVRQVDNERLPNLFMLRDSFTSRLIPYLSEHFTKSIYDWDHRFNADLIKSSKPDIVIHEIAERYLTKFLFDNPSVVKQNIFRRANEQFFTLPKLSNNIKYTIDTYSKTKDYINIEGQAFIEGENKTGQIVYIVLKSENKIYIFDTVSTKGYDNFYSRIPIDKIQKGNYKISIFIRKDIDKALKYTDKEIEVIK